LASPSLTSICSIARQNRFKSRKSMRRSGSIEMVAGEAAPRVSFAKMATHFPFPIDWIKTYNPDVGAARVGNAPREVGRGRKNRNENREFL